MQITGDAFTGVVFLRNAISVGVPFGINPWMDRDGLTNMFIICGIISLVVSLSYIPLVYYGKRIRVKLAPWYYSLYMDQKCH